MIIKAERGRKVPAWYVLRVMRRVSKIVARNPGFHRLVLDIKDGGGPYDTGWLVNPDAEPEIRNQLKRVLILEPHVEDEEPWAKL